MPEILVPGVYLAEIAFEAHAIAGVSTPLPGFDASGPVDEARVLSVGALDPVWTCAGDHDPGIHTLELLAWTALPLAHPAGPPFGRYALHPAMAGVVSGLEVAVSEVEDHRGVTVSPGLAIGPDGRTVEPDDPSAMRFVRRDPP